MEDEKIEFYIRKTDAQVHISRMSLAVIPQPSFWLITWDTVVGH
jgi:hypothetical protein